MVIAALQAMFSAEKYLFFDLVERIPSTFLPYVSVCIADRVALRSRYHNSEDLSDRPGYDFEQIAAIARVMVRRILLAILRSG